MRLTAKHCLSIAAFLLLVGCSKQESPMALGTLERDQVQLTATATEIITSLPIKEGSEVKKGDVLVTLRSSQQQSRLDKSIADQQKAASYLKKLTNGARPEDIAEAQALVVQNQANLEEKNDEYRRFEQLYRKKMVSAADRDRELAQRDIAKAELTVAKNKLEKLLNGERLEDIKQAQAALLAAQKDVELQQQILADYTIKATRNGLLESLPYHVGDRVTANTPVAILLTHSVPYARVYVPEPYRAQLQPGDILTVHVDGVDTVFKGKLRWVATQPSFTPYYALSGDDRARLVYLAEIDLPQSGKTLPAGIPVQVEMPNE
ncbi:HlyD family secretion protein [Photobacterium leiognathi]|uniref:HlyD family secretion protein n=1 Tax=Photobacterium leiognathi TaxID=553611 RepID=UPI002739EF0C|nr:HlyD family efflux transporter periplasmic adaptor subunit [Photobacterium leiognathi]